MAEARLRIRIGADTDQAEQGISRLSGSFGRLSATLGGAFTAALATGLAGLSALATAGAAMGVKYNAQLEQSAIAWETLLGSAEKAADMLKRISDFAKSTPFETADVDIMAKYMHNAGLEGQFLFDELMKISDTASAYNISADSAKEMARQMSQVRQAGIAYTEDLNILADRGVPIYKAISEQLGITVGDVKKMASEGKLTSDIYLKAFDGIAGGVAGASDNMSKTFLGMLSSTSDAVKIILGKAFEGTFERLKGALAGLQPILAGVVALMEGNRGEFVSIIANAFGPEATSRIVGFFDGLKRGIDNFQTAMATIKGVIEAFFASFSGNKGKAVSILASLGLDSDQIGLVLNAFTLIKTYLQTMFAFWSSVFQGMLTAATALWNFLQPYIMQALGAIVSFVQEKLAMIQQFWSDNGTQIMAAIQNFWNMLVAIFNFFLPVLLFIVKFIWDSIKGVIDGALKIIMGLVKIFAGIFTGDFGKVWEGVKQLFVGALQFLWNLMNLMLVGNIIKGIKTFGTMAVDFFKSSWTKIKDLWKGAIDGIWNIVDDFFAAIKELFTLFKQHGQSTMEATKNIFVSIWTSIKNGVMSVVNGLKDGAIGAFNGIKSTVSTIFETIKGLITNPIETAKKTVLGIIDAIKGAFSAMKITIPKPKLPKISVAMKKGVMGIPYPDFDVSWNAKGGIWDGASVIGVGEAGPEAVVPLKGRRMAPFAEAIASQMGKGGGGGGDIHITGNHFTVRDDRDIELIARELKHLMDRKLR